jgi:hypothetical protein
LKIPRDSGGLKSHLRVAPATNHLRNQPYRTRNIHLILLIRYLENARKNAKVMWIYHLTNHSIINMEKMRFNLQEQVVRHRVHG